MEVVKMKFCHFSSLRIFFLVIPGKSTTGPSWKKSFRRPCLTVASLLFNIYISDLPTTVSRKYAYAGDLASIHADGDWQAVEGVLSKDMTT